VPGGAGMRVGVSAAGRSRPRISEGGGCAERSRSRSDPVCMIDGSGGETGRRKATGVAQPLATAAIRRALTGQEWPNHHCIWQGTYGPHGRPVKWTRLARLERRSLIGRLCALARAVYDRWTSPSTAPTLPADRRMVHAREESQEDRAQTRRLQEEAEEAPRSRRRLKLGRSGCGSCCGGGVMPSGMLRHPVSLSCS
jgi:hypothetical protein